MKHSFYVDDATYPDLEEILGDADRCREFFHRVIDTYLFQRNWRQVGETVEVSVHRASWGFTDPPQLALRIVLDVEQAT